MIAPAIEELADDFDGQVKVGKVEVDNNQRVAAQYKHPFFPDSSFFHGWSGCRSGGWCGS